MTPSTPDKVFSEFIQNFLSYCVYRHNDTYTKQTPTLEQSTRENQFLEARYKISPEIRQEQFKVL